MPHQQRAAKPPLKPHAQHAEVHCTACGAVIDFTARKHPPRERNFCSKSCVHEWQRRTGHFKAMSLKGWDARSAAVTKSNHEKPRRKKRG